jgi:uncharacterized membrane protein (DUF485 family)
MPVTTHKLDHQRSDYERISALPEFSELRRRYRAFILPATAVFILWYLLYVVLSMWAPGFMGQQLAGNINVALVWGLLQFVSTFVIARLYSRYSTRELDPLARDLTDNFERGVDL